MLPRAKKTRENSRMSLCDDGMHCLLLCQFRADVTLRYSLVALFLHFKLIWLSSYEQILSQSLASIVKGVTSSITSNSRWVITISYVWKSGLVSIVLQTQEEEQPAGRGKLRSPFLPFAPWHCLFT